MEYFTYEKIQHEIMEEEVLSEGFYSLLVMMTSVQLYLISCELRVNLIKYQEEDWKERKIKPLFENN